MRVCLVVLFFALPFACRGSALPAQDPPAPAMRATAPLGTVTTDSKVEKFFESKVQREWEALKHKDRKAYGELLGEDYEGVELDGQGERTKIQALNELAQENVFNYTLWGFKVMPLGPDATFVIYEVTMQFPPKSVVRFSRLYIGELWVKREGEWREVHYQETHVK